MNNRGDLRLIVGPSSTYAPSIPPVPTGMLGLALVAQHWDATTSVINNAARMVPMNALNRLGQNIDTLFALIAEERLARDLSQRDLPAKKGYLPTPSSMTTCATMAWRRPPASSTAN